MEINLETLFLFFILLIELDSYFQHRNVDISIEIIAIIRTHAMKMRLLETKHMMT